MAPSPSSLASIASSLHAIQQQAGLSAAPAVHDCIFAGAQNCRYLAISCRAQICISDTASQKQWLVSDAALSSGPSSRHSSSLYHSSPSSQNNNRVTSMAWIYVRWRPPFGPLQATLVLLTGWEDGAVRCYDSRGVFLLEETLHVSPVVRIRVAGALVNQSRSQQLGRDSKQLAPDLLLVYLDRTVVFVHGTSLHAAVARRVQEIDAQDGDEDGDEVRQPRNPVASNKMARSRRMFNKWQLQQHESVTDAVMCARIKTGDLHALLDTKDSLLSVAAAVAAASIPLLAVGAGPILSYYQPSNASEGPQNVIAHVGDIAVQLKNKLSNKISSVFSWLSASVDEEEEAEEARIARKERQRTQAQAAQTAIPLSYVRCIKDEPRCLLSCVLSPGGEFAVTTDNLGRVLLVDLTDFVVMRMWKGYRIAQCAFVMLDSSNQNKNSQNKSSSPDNDQRERTDCTLPTLCLLVYTPVRGLLDAWQMPFGGKMRATQNMGVNGQLVVASCSHFPSSASAAIGGSFPAASSSSSSSSMLQETPYFVNSRGDVVPAFSAD